MNVGAPRNRDQGKCGADIIDGFSDDDQARLGELVDASHRPGRIQRRSDERRLTACVIANTHDDEPALGVREAHGGLREVLEGVADRPAHGLEVESDRLEIRCSPTLQDLGERIVDDGFHSFSLF